MGILTSVVAFDRGTQVTTRQGRRLGTLRERYDPPQEHAVVGRRTCFRIGSPPGLELCVPTARPAVHIPHGM